MCKRLLANAKLAHNCSINKNACVMFPAYAVLKIHCFPWVGKQKVSLRQEILGSGALEVTLFLDLGVWVFFRVVPREFFKMIQRWVLSLHNEVEKNITHLNEKVSASLKLLGIRALYLVFSLSFNFHLARAQLWGMLVFLLMPSFLFELSCGFCLPAKGAEESSSKNSCKVSYTVHEQSFIVSPLASISSGKHWYFLFRELLCLLALCGFTSFSQDCRLEALIVHFFKCSASVVCDFWFVAEFRTRECATWLLSSIWS